MDQHLNDTYDEQAALNPVFLFAYTLLQVPKTVLADHMLHASYSAVLGSTAASVNKQVKKQRFS